MVTNTAKKTTTADSQEACIDLPGEAVQCWRSSDKVRVILRKHRDVFFDINLQGSATYTVESKVDFYSPRDKKLLRKVMFADGEILNVWVGRNFEGVLELKANGRVLGSYRVNDLDTQTYGADPKTKPEPLMVIIGQREGPTGYRCSADDPLGAGWAYEIFKPSLDPKVSILSNYGSRYDYQIPHEAPEVEEYVAVVEVQRGEISPHAFVQLETKGFVAGQVSEVLSPPQPQASNSPLYRALSTAAGAISGSDTLTANWFKETVGYVQENFRQLDKLGMTVRIEKKAKGKYFVILRGQPLSRRIAQAFGVAKSTRPTHHRFPMGSEQSRFMDGGFARSGRAGYGGFKRLFLTAAKNFRGGVKIQGIGAVLDLFVDANSVFFDDKGSNELPEFLARAGVSILKAGLTAAIGAAFAAIVMAMVAATAPALFVGALVVTGFIAAAYLIDKADDFFQIKEQVAHAAR